MAHTAASPTDLGISLDDRVEDGQVITASLLRLRDGLIERQGYAIDHAEEQLLHVATLCDDLARRLRSVATYTVTGAARQGA